MSHPSFRVQHSQVFGNYAHNPPEQKMNVFLLTLLAYGLAVDPNVKITEVVCPESFSDLLACAWNMLLVNLWPPSTGTLVVGVVVIWAILKSAKKKSKRDKHQRSGSYDNRR
jgi:hypothetical protein